MLNKKGVRFLTLLDEKTYERLRKEAFNNRVSSSRIIRKALSDLFLKKDLQKFFDELKEENE